MFNNKTFKNFKILDGFNYHFYEPKIIELEVWLREGFLT